MLNSNWRLGFCCVFILAVSFHAFSDDSSFEIGTTISITSKVLNREMSILIHLPIEYEKSGFYCPVVYMMGYPSETRYTLAAAALEVMQGKGEIPPTILVGINLPDGNGVLIPRNGDTTGPDRYLRFVAKEVIPLVEASYRTVDYRILYGASNSGLFTVYSLLSDPGLFRAYVASSPMFGWCPNLLAERATEVFKIKDLPSRFLYIIYSDDDYDRVRESVPNFVKMLEKDSPPWLSYFCELRINEGHVSVNDVPFALKAIFPDHNPTKDLSTVDEFMDFYSHLTERYGYKILPPSQALFDVAIDHALAKRLDTAQKIFEYETALYPNGAYGHAGLGFVYKERGDIKMAHESLRRSLSIDPDLGWAKRMLKELEIE